MAAAHKRPFDITSAMPDANHANAFAGCANALGEDSARTTRD
jgi:hypothetical protein